MFIVQRPAKYSRRSSKSTAKMAKRNHFTLSPVWVFETEAQAVEFAKSFKACWVEVVHQGKVVYKNYNDAKPQWYKKLTDKAG